MGTARSLEICSAQIIIRTPKVLTPPHTSRFFVGRQKIFTCRLVCGEFRQVCDKIGACRAISDSARSQSVLSALSASVRWIKTFCRGSRVPQPMKNCHESREQAYFPTWRRYTRPQALTGLVATKNRLVCGKLTSRQIPNEKSAVVLPQKIG